MQKTNSTQSAQKTHRKMQVSTTRSRKDLRRPSQATPQKNAKATPKMSNMVTPKRRSVKINDFRKQAPAKRMTKMAEISEQEKMMSQMSSWDEMVAERDEVSSQAKDWDTFEQPVRETRPMDRTGRQSFDSQMPEEIYAQEAACEPEETYTPEETYAPEETYVPEETYAPEENYEEQMEARYQERMEKSYGAQMGGTQMESMPQRKIMHYSDMMTPMQDSYQQEMTRQEEMQDEMQHIPHPIQKTVKERMDTRRANAVVNTAQKTSAREMKEQAIQKAVASAKTVTKKEKTKKKLNIGFGRVMLAMACATAAVFAIVYFVNLNMPDITLKVAAMQTGIQATYPSYVPRDYNLSNITSESGKITLNFINATSGDYFTIVEEQSSWDSNALLNNFVKDTYDENYVTIREQGLTIYVSGSNATWVNGGVVYKMTSNVGALTKKQIKAIAVSL